MAKRPVGVMGKFVRVVEMFVLLGKMKLLMMLGGPCQAPVSKRYRDQ